MVGCKLQQGSPGLCHGLRQRQQRLAEQSQSFVAGIGEYRHLLLTDSAELGLREAELSLLTLALRQLRALHQASSGDLLADLSRQRFGALLDAPDQFLVDLSALL